MHRVSMTDVLLGTIGFILFVALGLCFALTAGPGFLIAIGRGLRLLAGAGLIAMLGAALWWAIDGSLRHRRRTTSARAQRSAREAERNLPRTIAAENAPDMLAQVEEAEARIASFRRLSDGSMLDVAIQAHSLIDGRLPAVMSRYAAAARSATPEERAELARRALSSLITVGDVAESARQAIVAELSDGLETESRFIEAKSAPFLPSSNALNAS